MDTERDRASVSRRGFLRTAAGGATAIGVASTGATAQATTIGMTDGLEFDPAEAQVQPGATVTWENVGTIEHSVTAYEEEIPGDAEYFASGDFDSESAARDAYPEGSIAGGETYEHTFEVEGEYGYFCIPHEGAGMVGTITVGGGGGGGGGGEKSLEELGAPLQAHWVGAATVLSIVVSLVFSFYVLKYGESPNTGTGR